VVLWPAKGGLGRGEKKGPKDASFEKGNRLYGKEGEKKTDPIKHMEKRGEGGRKNFQREREKEGGTEWVSVVFNLQGGGGNLINKGRKDLHLFVNKTKKRGEGECTNQEGAQKKKVERGGLKN